MIKMFNKFVSFILVFFLFFSFAHSAELDNLDDFKIVSTKIISYNEIAVTFNSNLYTGIDAIRDFNFINVDDSLDELFIEKTQIDNNNNKILYITFTSNAQANSTYELFVINLEDEFNRNIKEGVNGITKVTFPNEIIINEPIEELNTNVSNSGNLDVSINGNNVLVETNNADISIDGNDVSVSTSGNDLDSESNLELNSALDDQNNSELANLNSGQNVDENFVEKNVVSESKSINNLPKTGPENLFILLLALIFSGLMYIFKFKNS